MNVGNRDNSMDLEEIDILVNDFNNNFEDFFLDEIIFENDVIIEIDFYVFYFFLKYYLIIY